MIRDFFLNLYDKIIRYIYKDKLADEASNWSHDYLNDLMNYYGKH